MSVASSPVAPLSPPVWSPDCGDGTYRNPVLHADYSDPDVVRVGEDYYLTSSSFSCVPGLPLLHSRDLVNWRIVNHALPRLVPEKHFSVPRPGSGVWAPTLRHHAGRFWIYYPDPDFGLYVINATDPAGCWSEPVLVRGGKGLIDPCPLWDDDGRLYLIHGWARSRSGRHNVLTLLRLNADGRRVEEDMGVVIDGRTVFARNFHTLEGPKLYKRHGWYYVFAPAGGVATGWQSVFRARKITGPYEHRIVLAQGRTDINGPHQGALVDTPAGEWWFFHFQDKGAHGRVVHLQPVTWHDDWPQIGRALGADGSGEPVSSHRKPALPVQPVAVPATSDEFDSPGLGLQWQWQANPVASWFSLQQRPGYLRLFSQSEPATGDLAQAPHLLLQKFPAQVFRAVTQIEFSPLAPGETAGLIVFGHDYAWLGLRATDTPPIMSLVLHIRLRDRAQPEEVTLVARARSRMWLEVTVANGARCRFACSPDGVNFTGAGPEFTASAGHWVGAKIGLFASAPSAVKTAGCADFDFVRVHAARMP
jgi:beta-xylosidase